MRVAVISDIHGNALALQAVLADIEGQGVDALLNLGDHFAGPLEPVKTSEILAGLDMVAIRGNTDRHLFEGDPEMLDRHDQRTLAHLSVASLDWLKALPMTRVFQDQIVLSHGTPGSDDIYWLDRQGADGRFRKSTPEEIAREIEGMGYPLYCCGHTHVARVVRLDDGRIVFNPGSVGRPSFTMSDPESAARVSPAAAYAVATMTGGAWSVELRQVPYDHMAASRIAADNGSKGWARDVAEGRRR